MTNTSYKRNVLWSILFFKESRDVNDELDELIWKRTRIYMYTTAMLVALWGVFDVFIDFENLWIFLALRGIYTPITLFCAYNFHRDFFRKRHRSWAMVHYILLIIDIGVMVLWTDSFVKYLIGFSTIFWGASVIMLWRFWNTVVPGVLAVCIACLRFWFFPHEVPFSEFVTGLYYFSTCLVFTSVISAYGYWNAYLLAEKNMALMNTQHKLFQAEMASFNMVVASVAHEINTPVGTAITAVSHAQEEFKNIINVLDKDEVLIEYLEVPALDGISSAQSAVTELQRTVTLVERLRNVAVDQSRGEIRRFNLYDYIDENILNVGLRPILKKHSIFVKVEGDNDIVIDSYPGEYSQIFTNLVMNSLTHGFEGGKRLDKTFNITIKLVLLDALTMEIHYFDNGKGMSEEVIHRVFDPFFSTQKNNNVNNTNVGDSQGTGLGMNIVHNILTQKLNGTIKVYSTLGEGVHIVMKIPISEMR